MSTAAAERPRTKSVPASALQFDGGRVRFAAEAEDDAVRGVPIEMLARSSQPIEHWYWGKVVHDMAGFTADHPVIPVDFRHDDGEAIGFLDRFSVTDEGLVVSGQLTPITDDDRASTIIQQSAAGVPFQASIFFRPGALEEVPPGFVAPVNGYMVEGPAIIIRQWSLRGVAVCLYGADHRTSSQFSDGEHVVVPLAFTEPAMPASLTNPPAGADHSPSAEMAIDNHMAESAATPAASQSPPAAGDPREEVRRFVSAFGAENGSEWFGDGLSFSAAMEQHAAALAVQLSAKDAEIADLRSKLAAVDRGESTPLKFGDGEGGGAAALPQKFSGLGENLSRFAAGIKIPSSPPRHSRN